VADNGLLFELGNDPEPLPPLKEPRYGAINAKWTRWTGKHYPCDLCVQRIHDLGVGEAPPPGPARFKRVGPVDTLWLCAVDAEDMKRKDAEAETERQRRLDLEPAARREVGRRK
jgi:hypothetical protein